MSTNNELPDVLADLRHQLSRATLLLLGQLEDLAVHGNHKRAVELTTQIKESILTIADPYRQDRCENNDDCPF